jgi:hypothetical protein
VIVVTCDWDCNKPINNPTGVFSGITRHNIYHWGRTSLTENGMVITFSTIQYGVPVDLLLWSSSPELTLDIEKIYNYHTNHPNNLNTKVQLPKRRVYQIQGVNK